MAGLMFVVCSAIDELYRIGKLFIQSDGSFERCWKYILETRHENFVKRYLAYLDNNNCASGNEEFDNGAVSSSSLINSKENSFWWGYTPDSEMSCEEVFEFVPYDVVDYASIKVRPYSILFSRHIGIKLRYPISNFEP